MIQNLIQLGEPVEHRGIVVAPLFPRRDPVAAYVTLDEALAGGLRIARGRRVGERARARRREPARRARPAVRRRGARRREAEPHPQRERPRRGEDDARGSPSPASSRGAGARRPRTSLRGGPHLARASSGGARPRRRRHGRSRAASRRARSGTTCTRRRRACPFTRRPARAGDLYRALRARPAGARGRLLRRSRVSAARSSGSGATCVSTSSPGRTPSRACGRSSAPATCSTRSSVSTGSRRRSAEIEAFIADVDHSLVCAGSRRSGSARTSAFAASDVIGSGLELEGELIQLSAFRSETAAGGRSDGSRGRARGADGHPAGRARARP